MNKKSLDRKAAQKYIFESRNIGKSDQEIYNELSQEYYDKKAIALLITGTVTMADKDKFNAYNNILLGLLGLIILLRILFVFNLTIVTGQWPSIYVCVAPFLIAYFAKEIANYNAPV